MLKKAMSKSVLVVFFYSAQIVTNILLLGLAHWVADLPICIVRDIFSC